MRHGAAWNADLRIPAGHLHRQKIDGAVRRALEDAGLVTIELGPRGGMATAITTWTERSHLQKPTPRAMAMESDDERALEAMALGIA